MYCPSCGSEYTVELKYCNRCGANLGVGLEEQNQIVPISLTKPALIIGAVIAILTIMGFGMVITGAVELSHNPRFGEDAIAAIVVPGMLTILVIDILLVRQLSKIITASLSSSTQAQPKRTKALPNPTMAQLPQPPASRLQGVPSVTEGTTRFFEPYRPPTAADDRATAQPLDRKLEK
jgi:hypothetical protein